MINKVIVLGHLGRDPELRYTQSGTAVATLNLATNRRRRDPEGNYIDETEWHRVVAWSKTAEFCGNYLNRGSLIYVEGRLQTRKWKDQNNIERYTTEIVAETLQSLTPKNSRGAGGSNGPPPPSDADYGGGYGGGYGGDNYGGDSSGNGDFFGSGGGGGGSFTGQNNHLGGDSSDFSDSFKGNNNGGDDFGGDDGTGDDTPF